MPRTADVSTGDDLIVQENEIAGRMQTSVLPGEVDVEGLAISAEMLPAEVVGGDYYDIIPAEDGCWIAIGDVAGHGLAAGMIMLMIQGAVQSLVRMAPRASPSDVICALNEALYENIRRRMKRDEHVTFCLARYSADGQVVFAGGHENIVICRENGDFESIPARGTWLGARSDIRYATNDTTLQLQPGDVMVLLTDGAIEARNTSHEEFGTERLCQVLRACRAEPAPVIRGAIMRALRQWTDRFADDITLVVVRCHGVYWDR
jgi:serine phosphatase RsbU (regulator of sigma subunit)